MAIEMINSKAEFDERISRGKYLVDFYATWCGPCKMLAPVLEQIADDLEKDNITIIKVDVDQAQEIAMEYGVMSIPTMYLIEDGQAKAMDQGFKPANALMEWIKQA